MKRIVLLLLHLGIAGTLAAQYVQTILNIPGTRITDAIILDSQGNLFGSDYSGTNVYKRTPAGQVSVFATGFNTPNGLAFDSQDNLFVVDNAGNRVYKLSYSGTFLDTISITNPSGIIKDLMSDTMIVTQYAGNALVKLAPDGTIVPWIAGPPLNGPVGLAYDGSGELYVANFEGREIYKIWPDSLVYVATVPGPTTGNSWLGFIAHARGYLWATSFNLHRIYRIDPTQTDSVTLYAGSTLGTLDGPALTAKFNSPNGIIGSLTGDTLFISDFGSGRLRMITDTPASLEEGSFLSELELHPNPTTDRLFLQPAQPFVEARLLVFDAYGKQVWSTQQVSGSQYEISLATFPAGIYSIVAFQEGVHYLAKILKI